MSEIEEGRKVKEGRRGGGGERKVKEGRREGGR